MTLRLYTARVSYSGPDRLDITRKSGSGLGLLFAPSWSILSPVLEARRKWKAEGMAFVDRCIEENRLWDEYANAYLREMRQSYVRDRVRWHLVLNMPEATMCCYCTDPGHCHRTLLARAVFVKLGADYVGERDEWIAEKHRTSA